MSSDARRVLRRDPPDVATDSRSARYGRWTVKWRWLIVVAWMVGLIVLVFAPTIGTGGDQLASIIPIDSPAIRAEVRSVEEFGFPLSSRTAVVQRDPNGLSAFIQAESVLDAVAVDQSKPEPPLLGAIPITNGLRIGSNPGETNTTIVTYLFMEPRSSFDSQRIAAQRYVSENLDRPEDHVVGVTGSIPARAEQARLVAMYLPRLELLTVAAILVLVGVTFRSAIAPLVALSAAGIAFITTTRISHIVGSLTGIAAPAELEPVLVALLLGVVTDYTIFYVSAIQSRSRDSDSWRAAVTRAIASTTPIIVVAGLTVAAGTAALLAATSKFFQGFGPAMALAVLIALAVSVTFVPALLAILGRSTFLPRRPSLQPARPAEVRPGPPAATGPKQRATFTEVLTRRRVAAVVIVACVVVLGVASYPLKHMDLGLRFTTSLPPDSSVRAAADAAAVGFSPGITSPTTVLIEGKGITSQIGALANLQRLIQAQPGVTGIIGPAQNFTQRELGAVMSRSGDAARMLLILDSDPLDARAIDAMTNLRKQMPGMVSQSRLTGATVSLAGDTALAEGLVSSTGTDLIRIAVAGIAVNLLMLVLFLRALIAPLYLLLSSVLALSASLGLTVWVFIVLIGNEGLTFYVPFAAAVLLVSLGSDYNIFGVGSVWDEARRQPLRDAIIAAVPQTTKAISAAGLTLAVSFGMLAILPLSPFRELALAMTVGILLDTLVVRSLLLPCMLSLVGPISGWPGPHLRAPSEAGLTRPAPSPPPPPLHRP